MEQRHFEIGDLVIHKNGIKALDIRPGTVGTVVESLLPRNNGVAVRFDGGQIFGGTISTTVYVDESDLELVTPHKEPETEPRDEGEKQCGMCEAVPPLAGYIVIHEDGTGLPYAYRAESVTGFTDGVIFLRDGTEFDCEESFEQISDKVYEAVCL